MLSGGSLQKEDFLESEVLNPVELDEMLLTVKMKQSFSVFLFRFVAKVTQNANAITEINLLI